jgi:hypothetical protein
MTAVFSTPTTEAEKKGDIVETTEIKSCHLEF